MDSNPKTNPVTKIAITFSKLLALSDLKYENGMARMKNAKISE